MALNGGPNINSSPNLSNPNTGNQATRAGAQTPADIDALNQRYQEQQRRNAEQQYQEQAGEERHRQEEFDTLRREADELNDKNAILTRKAEKFNAIVDRYNSASDEDKVTLEPELRAAARDYNDALETRNRQADAYNRALKSAQNAGAASMENQPVEYDNQPVEVTTHKSTVHYDNSPDPELLTNLERKAEDVRKSAANYDQKSNELNDLIDRFNDAGTAEEQNALKSQIAVKTSEYNTAGKELQTSVSGYNTALNDAKSGGAVTADSTGIEWQFVGYQPTYTQTETTEPEPTRELPKTGLQKSIENIGAFADIVRNGIPAVTEGLSNTAGGIGSTAKILSLLSFTAATDAARKGDTQTAQALLGDAGTFAAVSHAETNISNTFIGGIQTVQHTPEQEARDQANMFADRDAMLKSVNAPEWLVAQNEQAKNFYTKGLVNFDSSGNVTINPPDVFTSAALTAVTAGIGGAAATAIRGTGAGLGKIVLKGTASRAVEGASVTGTGGGAAGLGTVTATEAETIAKLGTAGAVGSMLSSRTSTQKTTGNNLSEISSGITDDYSGVYQKWRELRNTNRNRTAVTNDSMITQRAANAAESVNVSARLYQSPTRATVHYGNIIEMPTSNRNAAIYDAAEINLLRLNNRNSEETSNRVRDDYSDRFRFNNAYQYRFNTEYEYKTRIPEINLSQKKKNSGTKKKKSDDDDYYLKVRSVITPKDLLGTSNKLLETRKTKSKDLFAVKKRRK